MKNDLRADRASRDDVLRYVQSLADIARESFVILDVDTRIVMANPVFYRSFHVSPAQMEGKPLFDVDDGRWDIPDLRTLLQRILQGEAAVKDFRVAQKFSSVGARVLLLNASRIYPATLIVLAMEDVTDRERVAVEGSNARGGEYMEDILGRIEQLEAINRMMIGRELKMIELKDEIAALQKKYTTL